MSTYVNWDIGGLVEIQDAVGPNGPVLLVTMSQYNNIHHITYPVDKRTEVEIALASGGFVQVTT